MLEQRERIADEKLHGLEIAALDKARESKLSKLSDEDRKEAERLMAYFDPTNEPNPSTKHWMHFVITA